jgi:two-component system cell cycle sensor histidine kinase/response regulator CckA
MATRKSTSAAKAALRALAEERLSEKTGSEAEEHDSAEQTQRLVHELRVHQLELEMQNEELQAARAELELGLERYADLYDFAPVGYVTLDAGGAIKKVNLAGARLLGQERAQLAGADFGCFISPGSRNNFAAFLRNVFATQAKQILDVALCPAKSAPLWVHIEATADGDDGFECRAVLIDVTERQRTQQALQRSEQHYRSLFESMDEGFALCEMIDDEAGQPVNYRYIEVNPAFARQTGLTVEHIVGRTVREVIPGIEHHWIEAFSRVTRTGVSERIENRVESLGKQFEVHAWRADAGRFAIAFTDVTVRRQTEERLRITHRMESVGRLAGGIAHDFNNILAIIISYADLAMEDLSEPEALQNSLTEIRTAGKRAAALTRQLLAFSRKQVLQPQVLDLNKIVSGMEGMLRRLLGEEISLAVVLAIGLGKVMADPGQIEQVLMNLAVNARDAMPKGGRLTIETTNTECDEACEAQHPETISGAHVRLSVTDTGCGMDEHTRARLFEPFFTTKEIGKGTGLGLATAYGIVQQSGGAIQVRSECGKGSTFTVLLPRELSGRETVTRAITLTTRAVRAETILLVEDENAVRTLVERVLSRAGYIVLTAENGCEALHVFEQHQGSVHLLLTDVVMPEMNGKQLADQLVLRAPHLRVLYMSGYTDEAIVDHGVFTSGAHFISKPFNPTQLTRMVRKALDEEMPSDQPNAKPMCSPRDEESPSQASKLT